MKNKRCDAKRFSFRKLLTAFFAVLFIFSLINTHNSFALANLFKIEDVSITALSGNAEGSVSGFSEQQIVSNVTFHSLNDTAKYTITLKNTSDKQNVIESITDDNENPYVEYLYDQYENTSINPGESFNFIVTAKYVNAVTNTNERVQPTSVKFMIKYVGVENPDTLPLVPDTSGNTTSAIGNAIRTNTTFLVISAIGLVILVVISVKNQKRTRKVVVLFLAAISAFTTMTAVRAASIEINNFTIVADYSLNDKLTVNYIIDGTNVGNTVVNYNEALENIPSIPAITGYTSDGWKLEDGSAFDQSTAITRDTVLSATHTAIHYNVAFDGNGATSGEMTSQEFEYDKAANLSENTYERSGYNYLGWNTRADGQGDTYADKASVENLSVTDGETITLYAQWERQVLTVNLHGNGLLFDDNSTTKVLEFANECHEQFFPSAQYSHTSNIDDSGTADGEYSINQATKDIVTVDGASKLHVTLKYGTEESWDMLYVFDGAYDGEVSDNMDAGQLYTLDGNYNDPEEIEFDIDGDTVTFAFFSDYSETYWGYYAEVVGLDADGEPLGGETRNVCERELIHGAYDEPVYDDETQYRYGWSSTADGEPEFGTYDNILTAISNNNIGDTVDFYAFWIYFHNIHFDANGGTGHMNDQKTPGGYPGYLADNYFYREGYDFLGWSTDPNATEIEYSDGAEFTAPNNPETTTLYAVWNKLHKITFDANGGTGTMDAQYIPAGLSDDLYSNTFTREHYTFFGWSENPDATISDYEYDDCDGFTAPNEAGETVLYAIWAEDHQIIFNANGGTGEMADQWESIYTAVHLNNNAFTREHYVFLGWSEDPTATTIDYADRALFTIPDEAGITRLYAIWQIDYRIIYDANGGTGTMNDQYVAFRPAIGDYRSATLSSNQFTREHYQFLGWSENSDAIDASYLNGGNIYPSINDPGLTTTLYAVWQPQHHITFDANGGEGAMSDQYINANSSAKLRANQFTKEGYMFVGWSRSSSSINPTYVDEGTFTTGDYYINSNDTILYAIWAKPYSISFDANGGEGDMTGYKTTIAKVNEKGTLVAPNFSRSGYGFLGWSADPDAGSKANNTNAPTIYGPNETITLTSALAATANEDKELTLYATWLEKDPNYTMQTFDKTAFNDKKVVALEDTRDGEVYAVGKQADNTWWMMENLRLNPSRSDVTINASNTNNPTSTFLSQIASYKNKPANQTYFAPIFNGRNDSCARAECVDHISYGLGNITREYESSPTAGSQEASWYSYGVVYNYYTASAGNGIYNSNVQNVAGDICPSNWRLPEGSESSYNSYVNEIMKLGNIMAGDPPTQYFYGAGGDKAVLFNKYPMNIVFSGIYGSSKDRSTYGSYRGKAGIYATNYRSGYSFSGELYIQEGSSYYGNTTQLRNYINKTVRCMAK